MKLFFKLMACAVMFMVAVSCTPTEKTFEKFLQKNYFNGNKLCTIESITFDKAYQTSFNDETCMDLLDELMDEAEDMFDYLEDLEDASSELSNINSILNLDMKNSFLDLDTSLDYLGKSLAYSDDYDEAYESYQESHKNYMALCDKLSKRESELDPTKLIGWEVICGYRYLKDNSYREIRFILDKRVKNILYMDFDGTELKNKAIKFLELCSTNDEDALRDFLLEY